jgi:hypothetical protein
MQTFEKFQATKRLVSSIGDVLSDTDMMGKPGFMYSYEGHELYVELTPRGFWTVMFSEDYMSWDLDAVERWLYDRIVEERMTDKERLKELDEELKETRTHLKLLEHQREELAKVVRAEDVKRFKKQLVVEFKKRPVGDPWGVFKTPIVGVTELSIVVRAADDATDEARVFLSNEYPKHSVSYVLMGDKFVGSYGGGHVFLERDLTGVNRKFPEADLIDEAVRDMGYSYL